MPRPLYERAEHLQLEEFIKFGLELRWNCDFKKLPISEGLDFEVTRKSQRTAFVEIGCYVEVKGRLDYSMDKIDQLGGYMLSMKKWKAAREKCDGEGLPPFVLVVHTSDGVWFARFSHGDFKADAVVRAGRRDRGDELDIEPCVLIGRERFSKVKGLHIRMHDVSQQEAA